MVMVGITVLNDVSLCVDEPADLALARYIVSHSGEGDPSTADINCHVVHRQVKP